MLKGFSDAPFCSDWSSVSTCVLYTREIIHIDQQLCILTMVDLLGEVDNIPSGCIKPGRWAKSVSSNARRLDSRKAVAFRCCATRNIKPWLAGEEGPLDRTLRLGGLKFHTVIQVIDVRTFVTESLERARSWSEMMALCNTFCSTHLPTGPYVATDEQITTALLRIITCDVFGLMSQRECQSHFQDRCYAAYQTYMRTLDTEDDEIWKSKYQLTKYPEKASHLIRGRLTTGSKAKKRYRGREAHNLHDYLERRVCTELRTVIHRKVIEQRFVVTAKGYMELNRQHAQSETSRAYSRIDSALRPSTAGRFEVFAGW